jgi:hypothetical protein
MWMKVPFAFLVRAEPSWLIYGPACLEPSEVTRQDTPSMRQAAQG